MPTYKGGCYCGQIRYEFSLNSLDEARTSICHCKNCRKFTGGESGITTKIPKEAFTLTKGTPTPHIMDNGSGTNIHREFCGTCGGPILEYGEPVAEKHRYVFWGTLDEPEALSPKGEFFCKNRAGWMPEVPNVFHMREIKE
ncbi:DUF636 domain protein, partial [Dacryopinax primogenitus]